MVVSKFLLKLLVEILKVLPNSEINLNMKIKTLLIFFYGISLAHYTGPLLPRLPPSSPGPAGLCAASVPHPVFASITGKRPRLSAPSW
jgi:hypothetical protein